jgi:peptidoglycan/xylan/chitin deacetylase (PgdA/CDA1 family)
MALFAARLAQQSVVLTALVLGIASANAAAAQCNKPLYLTFDTGHMEVAPLIAEVLARQQVKVTFFAANEPTKIGDGSLGEHWAPWWKDRALEGHAFASHTFDHVYWRGDVAKGNAPEFRMQATAGASAGKVMKLTSAQYCAEIKKSGDRLRAITQQTPLPLFRAPGGKTSPSLLKAAKSCGYAHVGWADAGFMGDELPSDKYPNEVLLHKALRDLRSGDIIMAHLGIWSRKDPWAPAVLEPLLVGLKAQGFCFETLRTHPAYQAWIAQHTH